MRWYRFIHQRTWHLGRREPKDHIDEESYMDRDPIGDLPLEPLTDFPEHILPNPLPIPEMFEVSATTEADMYRHGSARVELLDCLVADPDVCARLDSWGRAIGLIQASEELARAIEAAAQRVGLRHRSELWGARDREPREPFGEAEDAGYTRQVREAGERYLEALTRVDEVLEAATRYVRDELGFRWGVWLAYTLYVQVIYDANMHILGVERDFAYGYEPYDPPARDFTWTFANHPGETVSAKQRRFIEESNAAYAEIQAVPDAHEQMPFGRQRQDLEAKARRNARWFYRRKVRQELIVSIARDHHATRVKDKTCTKTFPGCACRTNVYDGIAEAERVLSLTPYFFGEPQEET
jgi:hypothetical protein